MKRKHENFLVILTLLLPFFLSGCVFSFMSVKPPSYSIKEGIYTAAVTVAINDPEANNITVYYTTDGSQPDTQSTVYILPIIIDETTTLKSIAVDGSGKKSKVETAVYTIDSETSTYIPDKANPGNGETADVYDQFMGVIAGMWVTQFPDNSTGVFSFYPINSITGSMTYTEISPEGYGDAYTAYYSIYPENGGYAGYIYLTGIESGGISPKSTTLYMEVNPNNLSQSYIEGFYYINNDLNEDSDDEIHDFLNNVY
ncbi:hypothetical protein AKG39_14065 [Acetobacterium bakii]|uniref:GH29D-like beta-sandwich domain-containing protein n=2 Tax=Acetobacterium bakii TaxID=52689 RepID=A0A0L6TXS3_9FIRM|nr:chitobiase/beta-hexosaminidase C-terminal domain-containing protein [Acetobacterium bakii]KNZ41079.1 hypothetical protein AKG39_14065 [Acetobacterium bakii]